MRALGPLHFIQSEPNCISNFETPAPTPISVDEDCCFPDNRTIEGYLEYKNSFKHTWKSYYFVLANNFLLWADSPNSDVLRRSLQIEGKKVKMKDNYTFTLPAKNHLRFFRTTSRNETLKWMKAFESAVKLQVTDIYSFKYPLASQCAPGTTVIAALHRKSKKPVAIKVVEKSHIVNKQRLCNEINIMKQIKSHSCMVKIFDMYESKANVYLVMELCEGGELLDVLGSLGNFKEDLTCHIMHQIARAVRFMHQKGIVHRDLKPENILCVKKDSAERIKVADFGISKHLKSINDPMDTQIGTPIYTAPEIIEGKPYGKEVDYWSLGVIMHILLCGYSPWFEVEEKGAMALEEAILNHPIELIDGDWKHVHDNVKTLVLRLLHRDPMKRATVDSILKITWKERINKHSCLRARRTLRGTIVKKSFRVSSMGPVEKNRRLMTRLYRNQVNHSRDSEMSERGDPIKTASSLIRRYIEREKRTKDENDMSSDDSDSDDQTMPSFKFFG